MVNHAPLSPPLRHLLSTWLGKQTNAQVGKKRVSGQPLFLKSGEIGVIWQGGFRRSKWVATEPATGYVMCAICGRLLVHLEKISGGTHTHTLDRAGRLTHIMCLQFARKHVIRSGSFVSKPCHLSEKKKKEMSF